MIFAPELAFYRVSSPSCERVAGPFSSYSRSRATRTLIASARTHSRGVACCCARIYFVAKGESAKEIVSDSHVAPSQLCARVVTTSPSRTASHGEKLRANVTDKEASLTLTTLTNSSERPPLPPLLAPR